MFKLKHFIFITLIFCPSLVTSVLSIPEGPLPDAVFDRSVKSVMFYKQGWEFSYPIYELNDEVPLIMEFDVLTTDSKNYNYSIVHCDAGWMPSRISYTEYMNGFYQNPLTNYQNSFNTYVPYLHYHIQMPNEDVQIKLPGNYALLVYEDGKEDEPVIIKRFTVVDQKINITGRVKRPTLTKYQDEFQEIDFTIYHPDFPIENPHQYLKVVIVKNNQWKFSITDLKPLFIRNKELVYDHEDKNIFPGGNEYRSFDTKNVKYQLPNIAYMGFRHNRYEVDLAVDKPRSGTPYFTISDLNGKFSVENQQGSDPTTDADYMFVKFSLFSFEEIPNSSVFVYAGFSDYNCYDDYKMKYNAENQHYEIECLVKQGYSNYQYVAVNNTTGDIDETAIEGSYSETENDYVIYVYYRPFGSRYDSLIGVKVLNSRKFD